MAILHNVGAETPLSLMRIAMRRFIVSVGCLVMAFAAWAGTTRPAFAEDAPAPRRVKVLFLGDNGHHQPLERCRQIYSPMAVRGIDFTYTDRAEDLNPQTLGRYDCLFLYANTEKISPEQEQALLDYVASGHGFVPIHCASFCFLNSPKITALTGARFKSHGTGVFEETLQDVDHPVMKGLKPIKSWDESYVHEMHNEDRQVLSYRVDDKGKEPYTWVRNHGKGRVFYTAWGHDQRTWGNEDFQNLIERGIRWAAGDWALAPQPKLAAFSYVEANVPNYIPNARWGTTGEAIRRMQEPLTPQESIKHLVVPPGFDVKLYASEPQVKKPICMAFDERGRLWVAETFDYPNEMRPAAEGRDRITICEDTDHDGVADKFTVFAEKLSIPTSLCFANGGLVVTQAPDTLFLKDTNGDDKADERKVLFTGWGTADTHAGPSNLRYGFDNWIYGTVGYSGFRGDVGGQSLSFGQGVFRMRPDGSKLEYLGSSNNNTWGLGFSESGDVLASTANDNASFYLHIPNRYYEQVRGLPARTLETIADSQRMFPITEHVRQVDQHGRYTAGAGHALYTARSFPQEFWNRIAFVSEPTGHLLGKYIIKQEGSAFKAIDDFSILASDDEWTSPISAEIGPDGSLWIIDWYNFIVQHNPIPPGFEKGKGNAYETPLRDKRHGRVYRLTWKDGKPSQILDLAKARNEKLLDALKSDNQLWRLHAQRLLVERRDKSVIPSLAKLASDRSVDAAGLNTTVIHALWTIAGLTEQSGGAEASSAASAALSHPSAAVRKNAVAVLPPNPQSTQAILSHNLLNDPDLLVRKTALLALSQMPANDAAGKAVYEVLSRPENQRDRGILDAATIAAATHDAGFLQSVFASYGGQKVEPAAASVRVENLIANSSFEEGSSDQPARWQVRTYSGTAKHAWSNESHSGKKSLQITSESGADSSWFINAKVEPDTDYRLTGWVRTENVGGAMGALFNVHGTESRTQAVRGTSDWTKLAINFNSGGQKTVSINCLFGGWGSSRGTAWFDDVELTRAPATGLPGPIGRAVTVVTNTYSQRGPADTVLATLGSLSHADAQLASAVVSGLAAGWPDSATPKVSEADGEALRNLMKTLAPDARESLITLAGKWNQRELFAEEIKSLSASVSKTLSDRDSNPTQRIEAARRLMAIDDSPAAVKAVLAQITPTAPPQTQVRLMDTLAQSHSDALGKSLVGVWGRLSPTAQTAAVNVLLRKPAWANALMDGIEAGTINPKDLRPENWQNLKVSPDTSLAQRAVALEKAQGRAPNPDKKKIIDALMPQVVQKGDLELGKAAFVKNCAVCHTLEGQGGKVGPELTGIGARPKADILAEVIDPNRSVEGTYRQWIVQTKDQQVLTGRMLAESRTSLELIDATGKRMTIDRQDIKATRVSEQSMMPEGFEQIPPSDLAGLLEYLAQSKVKH